MNIVYAFEILNYVESIDSENNVTYISRIDWRYRGTNENNITSYEDGTNYYTEESLYTSIIQDDLINMVISSNDIGNFQNKINIKIYNIVYPRTYRWFIYSLNTIPNFEGYENFVTGVSWRYNATSDSGLTANIEGQSSFNNLNGQYINYSSLNENTVISWIEGTENVSLLQEKLDNIINQKISPQIVNLPLPW